jgi:hypothetical protein
MVADLVKYYKTMRCTTSLKMFFFNCHLDFLPVNLRAVRDEQGYFHYGKSVPNQVESQYAG